MTLPSPALKSLQLVNDAHSFSSLLGLNYSKHIARNFYKRPEIFTYYEFSLPKKTGGVRQISAPDVFVKMVQRKLLPFLEELYEPSKPVHGFVKGRGIISNALPHAGRKAILNVDIEDFFGTINFGRVRGMLMAWPYNLHSTTATIIARICTYKGHLPQGAPTSPIIANMVAKVLDDNLRRLAAKYRCRYTRYADDLTFSIPFGRFPADMVFNEATTDDQHIWMVGWELREIITSCGFRVNDKKTSLRRRYARQEVTGLVVNDFVNCDRRFVRRTRAMLHSWETLGPDIASQLCSKRVGKKVNIEKVCRGSIEFIKSVKGETSDAYTSFAQIYNKLCGPKIKPLKATVRQEFIDVMRNNVFVIQDDKDFSKAETGTAFFVKEYNGFFTCAHVLGDTEAIARQKRFWVYNPLNPTDLYEVKIAQLSDFRVDIALLELVDHANLDKICRSPALKFRDSSLPPKFQEDIKLIGFPNFRLGLSISVKEGKIQSAGVTSGIDRWNISTPVIQGNSGGPVLDNKGDVIGIAVTGNNTGNKLDLTEFHSFIPHSVITKHITVTNL